MAEHKIVGFDEEQMKIVQSYRLNEARMRDKITRLQQQNAATLELVKRMVERGVDWHEWSCPTTHGTGLPCDCGGTELEAEARAVLAKVEGR